MPYNKGDFTQQGVAGHVNANLRLNEKRLVNIDMTSNEEAEGCTITGTVKDLLNDKVYPIGSGVSGNIEITENTAEGEPLDIAQYATATVNVSGGGGDIPLLTVTFNSSSPSTFGDDTLTNRYDNNLLYTQQLDLDVGITTVQYMGVLIAPDTVLGLAFYSTPATVTDLVNCTFIEGGGDPNMILITDPSQNSSVTITIA